MKVAWLNDHGKVDPLQTILSLTNKSPEVCDLGCGGGTFLSRTRDHGAIVTGLDPNAVCADALRLKGIEFHPGTAEDLPLALRDRRFDVVSMFQSLMCCREPASAVSNAVSLLKPDGLLVIDVPNNDCLGFKKYGPAWWYTDAGRNLHFFTKKSLARLFALAGVEPIRWEYRGFTSQFTTSSIDSMAIAWDGIFKQKMHVPTDSDMRPVQIDIPPRPSLSNSVSYFPYALLSGNFKKYSIIRAYAKRKN